jgi:hypothetical protein
MVCNKITGLLGREWCTGRCKALHACHEVWWRSGNKADASPLSGGQRRIPVSMRQTLMGGEF